MYSTDRSEEMVINNYPTATLDLKKGKRGPKGSVPYADTDDDPMPVPGEYYEEQASSDLGTFLLSFCYY